MASTNAAAFNDGDEYSRTQESDGICPCLQDCATRELISPCSCRGTLAHVHRHCFSDMKCDICGTHYELEARGLRTWREWKWTRPRDLLNSHLVFFSIMFVNCVKSLNDLKCTWEMFRMVSSPGPVLSFIVWLLCGPLHWCVWALLAYSLLYGVKHAYFATKQWIADNTVYEWKDGGTLKKGA